jgi:anti-sigma B factor antagonist
MMGTTQVILFRPEGRIDLQGGMILSKKMSAILPHRNQLWVINLADVDFMDSAGLIPLVKALKAARGCGCRLVLCNVASPVRLILELTQLDSVFEIFHTYEDIQKEVNNNNLVVAA